MPRSLEDRWFSFGVHSVDALTEMQAGLPPTYSVDDGRRSFIEPEAALNPAEYVEARTKGLGHVIGIFEAISEGVDNSGK